MMALKRLETNYPTLHQFLASHFHQDAFYECDFAKTMNDLISDVINSLFMNRLEIEPAFVKELRGEMERFLNDVTFDSFKIHFLEENVDTDMGGLEPLEFLRYLYYTLKMEVNERRIQSEEGEEEI